MEALIALLSAFSAAGYFVYVSYVMKRRPALSSGLVLAVGHLVAAVALFPFASFAKIGVLADSTHFFPLFYAATLLIVSRQLFYYAYARTDVANITVFSALTPVYALGAGYFMLGEVPTVFSLVGLALICVGVYSIFLNYNSAHSVLTNLGEPFAQIARSRAIAMAFLSTIPTAFAAVYQKKLLLSVDAVTFSIALLFVIGIVSLAIELARSGARIFDDIRQLPWHFYLASAVLLSGTHVLFCLVMQTQHTAISLVLQRCAIVFQILLAYFFLHEKKDIQKRLWAVAVIMMGFLLIIEYGN